jgi:hypothetical protein
VLSLGIGALVVLEHDRSIRPSSIIIAYLLASVLFDAVQLRTLLLTGSRTVVAATLSVTLFLKSTILVLELRSKSRLLRGPYNNVPPEGVSSVISRALYWWTVPLLAAGYRRLLSSVDLFAVDDGMRSTDLGDRLNERVSNAGMQISLSLYVHLRKADFPDMSKRHAFLRACLLCFHRDILAMVPTRLALICFTYSQSFLLERAVNFLSQPTNDESDSIRYGLIGATFFIYLGMAVSRAFSNSLNQAC